MYPVFSRRTANLHASPIREILSVIDRPGMISFAGGLPAPASFPSITIDDLPTDQLQYGPSEGEPELRAQVADHLRRLGLKCSMEQVLILSGSQQGIDLAGKLFVDEGTPVALESPTYLAALQVFRFFGARFHSFRPGEANGDALQRVGARLLYAIPTFANPSGHCYTSIQRHALARACDQADVTLFEDDPYRDLVYEDCDRTPVCAQLERASWIYQGSFSKSFAPGLRVGFLAASPSLIAYLTRLKQAADLHTSRISQWIVLGLLRHADRDERLTELAQSYARKRDFFDDMLRKTFGEVATWQAPPGGLFFWLRLKRSLDTRPMLARAISQGVAFMPGENFFAEEGAGLGTLRLNFSHASDEQARPGLNLLARLLNEEMASVCEVS